MSTQDTPKHNDDSRDKKTLESDIYSTRYRLDQTLTTLEDRLSPQQLMNDTFDYFRYGGPGEFTGNLGDSVKNNPVPFLLTAVGISWLILAPRSGPTHHNIGQGDAKTTTASTNQNPGQTSDARSSTRGALDAAKDKLGAAGNTSRSAASGVRDSARGMKDSMGSGSAQMRDRSRAAVQNASRGARNATTQTVRFVENNPLAAAGIGIGIGIAVGGLFSASQMENEQFGDMRDDLVDKASQVGSDKADKLRSKVDEKAKQTKPDRNTSSGDAQASNTGPSSFGDAGRSLTGTGDPSQIKGSSSDRSDTAKSGAEAQSTSAAPAKHDDAPLPGARQTPGKGSG